jgi:hypothetical protein
MLELYVMVPPVLVTDAALWASAVVESKVNSVVNPLVGAATGSNG